MEMAGSTLLQAQANADMTALELGDVVWDTDLEEDKDMCIVEKMLETRDEDDEEDRHVKVPLQGATEPEVHITVPAAAVADQVLAQDIALSESLGDVAMDFSDAEDNASSYGRCASLGYLADCEEEDNSDTVSVASTFTDLTEVDEYMDHTEEGESQDMVYYEPSEIGARTPYAVSECDSDHISATMSSMGDTSWGSEDLAALDGEYIHTPRAVTPVSGYDGSCTILPTVDYDSDVQLKEPQANIHEDYSNSEPSVGDTNPRAGSPIDATDYSSDTTEPAELDFLDYDYQTSGLSVAKERSFNPLTDPIMSDAIYADEDPNTLITDAFGTTDSDFAFSDQED